MKTEIILKKDGNNIKVNIHVVGESVPQEQNVTTSFIEFLARLHTTEISAVTITCKVGE